MTETEWTKLIVNLGALGLVAWLFVHTFRVTIPSMIDAFRQETQAQRQECEMHLTAQREECRNHITDITGQLEKMIDSFRNGGH